MMKTIFINDTFIFLKQKDKVSFNVLIYVYGVSKFEKQNKKGNCFYVFKEITIVQCS